MPRKPSAKDFQAQLEQSYEAARTTYTLAFQIITMAVAAVGVLVTAAFELENATAVSIAGFVLVILVFQLRKAGKILAAILATARRLELLLGLPPGTSLTKALYGALEKAERVKEMDAIAAIPKGKKMDRIAEAATNLAIFQFRGTTAVALVIGVLMAAAGLYYSFTGWPLS